MNDYVYVDGDISLESDSHGETVRLRVGTNKSDVAFDIDPSEALTLASALVAQAREAEGRRSKRVLAELTETTNEVVGAALLSR